MKMQAFIPARLRRLYYFWCYLRAYEKLSLAACGSLEWKGLDIEVDYWRYKLIAAGHEVVPMDYRRGWK